MLHIASLEIYIIPQSEICYTNFLRQLPFKREPFRKTILVESLPLQREVPSLRSGGILFFIIDKHGVTEGEEAIFFFHSDLVGIQHNFASR